MVAIDCASAKCYPPSAALYNLSQTPFLIIPVIAAAKTKLASKLLGNSVTGGLVSFQAFSV